MKEKIYIIEILNLDTGIKIRQQLQQAQIRSDQIMKIIESYNPEVDFQTLSIYFYTSSKWVYLYDQNFNLEHHESQWQDCQSGEVTLKIKYKCSFLFEEEEEKRFEDQVSRMNEKVNNLQGLYQDLKEKYKQEALDINVFWGSPLFACDKLQRNKKGIETVTNSEGQEQQLLVNQVKYAPYINAVTSAIESCDKVKVNLELKLLNEKAFSQKNIFTVVYLIAHLEIQQIYTESSHGRSKKQEHKKKKKQKQSKQEKKKAKKVYVVKTNKVVTPDLKKTESEPDKIELLHIPSQSQKQISQNNSFEFEMIIQENQGEKLKIPQLQRTSLQDKEFLDQNINFEQEKQENVTQQNQSSQPTTVRQHTYDYEHYFEDEENIRIYNSDEDLYYQKDHKNRRKAFRYYFLGEDINGRLIKISPKKLRSIIKQKQSRNIELLLLHTSFPYYHLDEIRDLANNIILINSNPLFPEPSTIYFIKLFFIHLLKTGNIEQTYQKALQNLNRLKQITSSPKFSSHLKEFDAKDLSFIKGINERYVHGSFECCCCYHKHHQKCHNKRNISPSKYAEYHYKYHAAHCACTKQNLMIHTCEGKRLIMEQHYQILSRDYEDIPYYYCCCLGKDMGFYEMPVRNTELANLVNIDEERDPHSIKFKYKHEKMFINSDDNQVDISQGKAAGDYTKEIVNAFKYIEDNPLLGNAKLLVKLLEIFTKELQQSSLDIIRRTNHNEVYMLCNLFGEKSTGRKTIATFFANMLIIKKLCKRIVTKVFSKPQDLRGFIQTTHGEPEGRPFFIFIHQDKSREKTKLHFRQYFFGQPISAIIITQQQITMDEQLRVEFLLPFSFNNDNCQHFVKKYKHLSFEAKNNIKVLFNVASRGYENNQNFTIYPFSLNQFQILNLVRKTHFINQNDFVEALDRLSPTCIQYYIFIMYTLKFTCSGSNSKNIGMHEIQGWLQDKRQKRSLFFKEFDDSVRPQAPQKGKNVSQTRDYSMQVIKLDQIKLNFFLIFAATGSKMRKKIQKILRMFINYTSVIISNKFNEDSRIKRDANFLRTKYTPFSKQVYEATSINSQSYINRYFGSDFRSIYRQYTEVKEDEHKQMHGLEEFLNKHSSMFNYRKVSVRKTVFQTHSKPKQKKLSQHYSSVDLSSKQSYKSSSQQQPQQCNDISNIYHLSSIAEGGLQFVRNLISTHFLYNRLSDQQKIQVLKLCLLLVNNCIILLKSKKIYDIDDDYDIDVCSQEERESVMTQRFFHSTHFFDSPDLKSRRSEEIEAPLPSAARTYSGRDIFNSSRQLPLQSAVKSGFSQVDDEQQSQSDELLLKQLHRLNSYKGLLFLMDEIQRRAEQFSQQLSEAVVRIKISTQLLSIQIRLQQLQIKREKIKIVLPPQTKDRHLLRIAQIFNEKNYNINILYRILRDEINQSRFSRDIEELGIIKSHIIVALTLMASRYGKCKIVKAKSMVGEIDMFVSEWNQIPYQRRESQQDGGRNARDSLTNTKDLPSQYGFLKLICENQYVYIHILESFTSEKFWPKQFKRNEEIEVYGELLRLYHHFNLKSTKTKQSYYYKLEAIVEELRAFKKRKEFYCFATYIHNFVEEFIENIQEQFKAKLKPNLIAIFTADDGRDFAKASLTDKLDPLIKSNINSRQFFITRHKFNLTSLKALQNNGGCKYLCIFTSIGQANNKEDILVESQDGRCGIVKKKDITDVISAISTSVIFICLPKKKMLAQSIIKFNRFKRPIVFFDFEKDYFHSEKGSNFLSDVVIFQKMIMIETVKELIEGILKKENEGFKSGLYMAFNDIKNSLSFVLKSQSNKVLLSLPNKYFRQALCIDEKDNFYDIQIDKKQIEFYENQKITVKQIDSLEKIVKKFSTMKENLSIERFQEIKLDEFGSVHHFIQIFSFYFRQKYQFDHIYNINFAVWKQQVRSNEIIIKFLQKLTNQKILDFIFSNKKGIIMMYVPPQNFDTFTNALKSCQIELKNIISNINQSDEKRIISKFVGCSNINRKKVSHIFIYILTYEDGRNLMRN